MQSSVYRPDIIEEIDSQESGSNSSAQGSSSNTKHTERHNPPTGLNQPPLLNFKMVESVDIGHDTYARSVFAQQGEGKNSTQDMFLPEPPIYQEAFNRDANNAAESQLFMNRQRVLSNYSEQLEGKISEKSSASEQEDEKLASVESFSRQQNFPSFSSKAAPVHSNQIAAYQGELSRKDFENPFSDNYNDQSFSVDQKLVQNKNLPSAGAQENQDMKRKGNTVAATQNIKKTSSFTSSSQSSSLQSSQTIAKQNSTLLRKQSEQKMQTQASEKQKFQVQQSRQRQDSVSSQQSSSSQAQLAHVSAQNHESLFRMVQSQQANIYTDHNRHANSTNSDKRHIQSKDGLQYSIKVQYVSEGDAASDEEGDADDDNDEGSGLMLTGRTLTAHNGTDTKGQQSIDQQSEQGNSDLKTLSMQQQDTATGAEALSETVIINNSESLQELQQPFQLQQLKVLGDIHIDPQVPLSYSTLLLTHFRHHQQQLSSKKKKYGTGKQNASSYAALINESILKDNKYQVKRSSQAQLRDEKFHIKTPVQKFQLNYLQEQNSSLKNGAQLKMGGSVACSYEGLTRSNHLLISKRSVNDFVSKMREQQRSSLQSMRDKSGGGVADSGNSLIKSSQKITKNTKVTQILQQYKNFYDNLEDRNIELEKKCLQLQDQLRTSVELCQNIIKKNNNIESVAQPLNNIDLSFQKLGFQARTGN